MRKWIGSGWLGLLVVLILATPGVARADWGDIWGEMLWGGLETPFVPALPPGFEWALALLLLAAALGARRARPRTAALLLTLALVPGLARAGMVVIPHKMVNGTVADAVEVNENFDALATAFNDFSGRFGLDPPDPEGSPVFSEGECANLVIGEVWMFAGPYPRGFYRTLHRLVHSEHRLRRLVRARDLCGLPRALLSLGRAAVARAEIEPARLRGPRLDDS